MLPLCPLLLLLWDAVVGELSWSSHDGATYPRGNDPIRSALVFAPLPGAVVWPPVLLLPGRWQSESLIVAVRLQSSSGSATLCVLPTAKLHKSVPPVDYRGPGCDRI